MGAQTTLILEANRRSGASKGLAKAQPAAANDPIECPRKELHDPNLPDSVGRHKVTLSWNPSATASRGSTSMPIRYCLYRRRENATTAGNAASKKGNNPEDQIPKNISDCKGCQLITPTAIPGTECIDDRVLDDSIYYYAVIAVSRSSVSGANFPRSNVATANTSPSEVTPADPQKHLCRTDAPAQPDSGHPAIGLE